MGKSLLHVSLLGKNSGKQLWNKANGVHPNFQPCYQSLGKIHCGRHYAKCFLIQIFIKICYYIGATKFRSTNCS
jgi:hypothetical protein